MPKLYLMISIIFAVLVANHAILGFVLPSLWKSSRRFEIIEIIDSRVSDPSMSLEQVNLFQNVLLTLRLCRRLERSIAIH